MSVEKDAEPVFFFLSSFERQIKIISANVKCGFRPGPTGKVQNPQNHKTCMPTNKAETLEFSGRPLNIG